MACWALFESVGLSFCILVGSRGVAVLKDEAIVLHIWGSSCGSPQKSQTWLRAIGEPAH